MPEDEHVLGREDCAGVRALARDEWAVLRTVRLEALRDSPGSFSDRVVDAERWPPARWVDWLDAAPVFVAGSNEQPVGMVAVACRDNVEDRGLAAMWVAPRWRGADIADRLVTAVLRWAAADNAERVTLWVGRDMAAAQRMYSRHGFSPTGATKPTGLGEVVELAVTVDEHGR